VKLGGSLVFSNETKLRESYGKLNNEEIKVHKWMSSNPCAVTSDQTVREVAELLNQYQSNGLPIIDDNRSVIGWISVFQLSQCILKGISLDSPVGSVMDDSIQTIGTEDTVVEAAQISMEQIPVIDEDGMLVGILNQGHILAAYSYQINLLQATEYTAETLNAVLESAYEGVVVCDGDGIIREFNQAYSRFLGKKREEVIGKHVTEIIENTGLHITVKTGTPERGYVQRIQGQDMVVHRIPIWKENKVIGAIGMLIFEGVTELYGILERMQELSRQVTEKSVSFKRPGDIQEMSTFDQIIEQSEEIAAVKRVARKAADKPSTILITGESGTGKEMFAKAIHHASRFAEGPFISVNCAAIPEHLLEAELFGYEDGAFTGARKGGKPGKFELAHKGTLFLDEIGDMPLLMQSKILRALQERVIERVGGVVKLPFHVRIVAATNRSLEEMVSQGLFREDLYYRLNIIRLHIPPLRERKKDIPFLLAHHLRTFCESFGMLPKQFTRETMSILMDYHWPGNVRELLNTVEMLVSLVEGHEIQPEDLPPQFLAKGAISTNKVYGSSLKKENSPYPLWSEVKDIVAEREKDAILQVLSEAKGNKAAAARELGIHRSTLYEKLRKYGI
jgi:transcriptional regulator with PAS, ATPase and Fis domain